MPTPQLKYLRWSLITAAIAGIICLLATLTAHDWLVISLVLLGVSILGFIGLLVAGATQTVVIYYDPKDLLSSFLAFFLPVMGVICSLLGLGADSIIIKVVLGALIPIALIIIGARYIAINYTNAISHSRNKSLGCLIGTFKVLFVIWAIFGLWGSYSDMTAQKKPFRSKFWALIWFGIVVAMTKRLVNGPDVYRKKGWTQVMDWKTVQ